VNFAATLAAAQRAQAAYIEDRAQSQAAFSALGLTWLDQYQNAEHQAVLCRGPDGTVYLSISGTRFADGAMGDVWEDICLDAVNLPGGADVVAGAYNGLDAMWSWAKALVSAGTVFNVEGHSLGAWRTRYTPLFLPAAQIGSLFSFESPKAGNPAFWMLYGGQLANMVSVVNGLDLFVSWPFLGEWCHPPRDEIWLQDTGFQVTNPSQWPGGRRLSDHSIDLVVQRLKVLATAP
jgi:hypothetical protein